MKWIKLTLICFIFSNGVWAHPGGKKAGKDKQPDASATKTLEVRQPKHSRLRKVGKRVYRCFLHIGEQLVDDLFQLLLCIAESEELLDFVIVDLTAAFQGMQFVPPPLPPPAYQPEDAIGYVRQFNPELWQKLGLDSLTDIHCDTGCQQVGDYTERVDVLRNSLARQDENPGQLPVLDVYLQDITGNEFSLSELPFVWLRSPEVVNAIEGISERNKATSLKKLAEGLTVVRQIFQAIHDQQHTIEEVRSQVKRARFDDNIEVGSYRLGKKDVVDHVIEQLSDRSTDIHRMGRFYRESGLKAQERHLHTSLGKRKRGDWATYEQHSIVRRLTEKDVGAEGIDTMAYALDHNVDASMVAIMLYGFSYHQKATVEHLKQFLRKPVKLCCAHLVPKCDCPWEDRWEEDIGKSLISNLRKQGIDLNSVETEHGSLVDYALAVLPKTPYYTFYDLYQAGVDATIPHLLTAIQYAAEDPVGFGALPARVIERLSEQGVDLSSWRSEEGETFGELGSRLGVPGGTLSDLYRLNKGHREVSEGVVQDKAIKTRNIESAKRKRHWTQNKIDSILAQTSPFVIQNVQQYRANLAQVLLDHHYSHQSVLGDGQCFFHALEGVTGINQAMLQRHLLDYLRKLYRKISGGVSLSGLEQVVMNMMGDQGLQQAISLVSSGQWGEMHYLQAVVAMLSEAGWQQSLAVISPSAAGAVVITLVNESGPAIIEQLPDHLPVLIFNGVDHWDYAIYDDPSQWSEGNIGMTQNPDGGPNYFNHIIPSAFHFLMP